MANKNLTRAKAGKNDEFYTQLLDITNEMNAYIGYNPDVFRDKTILLPCDDPEWSNFTRYFALNFEHLGIKKLISTSYAPAAILRGEENPDPRGRIGILELDANQDGKINTDDIQWSYLEGDGDFRSAEVAVLRDEADFIITNPPFSLFREFMSWVMESGKKFSMIGNINAITYKEIFPLIQDNKVWLGAGFRAGNAFFRPGGIEREYSAGVFDEKTGLVKFRNASWFTNIDHGRRHQPLQIVPMHENLTYNKKMQGKTVYDRYDNSDVIDVPFTMAIPSDYDGVMGVPISFLDKYCPEQFEILGIANSARWIGYRCKTVINGKNVYNRIIIKRAET